MNELLDQLLGQTALEWKGSSERKSFPHICPYRTDGMDKHGCLDISGGSVEKNAEGCCGAVRGMVRFAPCNADTRRCIVCLKLGRRELKANAVSNVERGTCDEHVNGLQ